MIIILVRFNERLSANGLKNCIYLGNNNTITYHIIWAITSFVLVVVVYLRLNSKVVTVQEFTGNAGMQHLYLRNKTGNISPNILLSSSIQCVLLPAAACTLFFC